MLRGIACLLVLLLGPVSAKAGADAKSPLARYAPQDRAIAEEILDNITFQAEKRIVFQASPDVFFFLVDHPVFAAAVSRGIGHEKFHVRREKEAYRIEHGHAKGSLRRVDRQPDGVAYLAWGTYENPAFRWLGVIVRARSYVVETFEGPKTTGKKRPEMAVRIRGYLDVENAFLGWLFRLIAPLARRAFEDKLTGAHRIAPELSQMACRDGKGFIERMEKIEELDAAQLREFVGLIRRQQC